MTKADHWILRTIAAEPIRERYQIILPGNPAKIIEAFDLATAEYVRARLNNIDLALAEARREEREACAQIAEAQPFYPDTHTGMRQQWIKDQIAAAICQRSRGEQG